MKPSSIFTFALTAIVIIGSSSVSFAEPPAHAKNGKAKMQVENVQKSNRNAKIRLIDDQPRNCPPGLSKKSPACIPPGQAKKWGVGDIVDWDNIHIVTQPGYYGLSTPPDGDRYAIIDGQLVRVNRESGQILSILRMVEAILD